MADEQQVQNNIFLVLYGGVAVLSMIACAYMEEYKADVAKRIMVLP